MPEPGKQHWNTITGLPLEKQMMLDELAHGLVTPRSLAWICEMIRAEQLGAYLAVGRRSD